VEHLASFSLSGLSPFARDLGTGRLHLHRFRSAWAAEGRHERRAIEDLHLEPAWAPFAPRCERYGQVGSIPVNGFFPWGAVEDAVAGVFWGAQICHPGSWQIECYRGGDELALAGGLADREFGQWWKTLAPGASFTTPTAWIACVAGGLDDLCQRLTAMQVHAVEMQPASERRLPILFNEFCTSWGSPDQAAMIAVADRLQGTDVEVCVVDDGWAERPEGATMQSNGDWVVDQRKFPGGLRPTFEAIRQRGLAPGVWYEFEVCNPGSKAWDQTAHHLHRDGSVLRVGGRRFWDFRDTWTHEYLAEKVIALLRDSGASYLKVDYNDSIGFGVDGCESPGEGLRQHLDGVQRFFRRIRSELPEVLIENCSSGGHRLEPSMLGICAMGSFSDAHESPEIPIIAANLQRLILPRQAQIWAVLHAADSDQRLI
jgi:alpha-galactosidase